MKLYHATDLDKLSDILDEGLKPSSGVIYFAESYQKALAFLILRPIENIIVFEVELPEEQLTESFDRSESMFCRIFKLDDCRAWTYDKSIPAKQIDFSKARVYNREGGK